MQFPNMAHSLHNTVSSTIQMQRVTDRLLEM